jgi:IS1 family transposase
MNEMWSRVYCKETLCWLWHAINHENDDVVAYVLGSREHETLSELLDLLDLVDVEIVAVYSDDNYAYHEAISRNVLQTGKRNTQRIERKHLTFRQSPDFFYEINYVFYQNASHTCACKFFITHITIHSLYHNAMVQYLDVFFTIKLWYEY